MTTEAAPKEQRTRVAAVRAYLMDNKDGHGREVGLKDFQAFWTSCTDAEKKQFGDDAARMLGCEVKE